MANDGFYEREHYFTNIPSAGIRSTIRLSVALSAQHAYRNRAMRMRSSARLSRMRSRRLIPLRLESVGRTWELHIMDSAYQFPKVIKRVTSDSYVKHNFYYNMDLGQIRWQTGRPTWRARLENRRPRRDTGDPPSSLSALDSLSALPTSAHGPDALSGIQAVSTAGSPRGAGRSR